MPHNPGLPPAAPPGSGPAADPLVGGIVAEKYRVIGLVARGGMGRIYRAEQAPLGREVALKILTRPPLGPDGDDAPLEKRCLLEAATCGRLRHPNTVTVFDCGGGVLGVKNLLDWRYAYPAGDDVAMRTLPPPGRTAHVDATVGF